MRVYLLILLFLSSAAVTNAEPELIKIWEQTYDEVQINYAKFSPDGKYIYAMYRYTIKKISAETGEELSVFDNSVAEYIYELSDLKISKSGKYLVTTNFAGAAIIWDTEQEKAIKFLKIKVATVDISLDDNLLYISSDSEYKITIYDWRNEEVVKESLTHPIQIRTIKLSPNGQLLAGSGIIPDPDDPDIGNSVLKLYDAENLSGIKELFNASGYSISRDRINFSNDDMYLSYISINNLTGFIYEIDSYERIFTSDSECLYLKFLPNNYNFFVSRNFFNGNYEFQLHNLDQYIKSFDDPIAALDFIEVNDRILMFYRSRAQVNKCLLHEVDLLNSVGDDEIIPFSVDYSDNHLSIIFEDSVFPNYSIEIYNISGSLIFSQDSIEDSNSNYKLNLASGAYICKIIIGNKTYTKKFIIGGK